MRNIDEKSLGKISGGMSKANIGGHSRVWCPKCAKCGKEMPGGIGGKRVDGTIYAHPYFCKSCAGFLTDAEKNINSTSKLETLGKV